MIGFLFQLIFDALVHVVATFTAAVLAHPAVQKAAAGVVVEGLNNFITQPDVDEKFQVMSDTMSRNQAEYFRSVGEGFPKLAGKFIEGMVFPKSKEKHGKGGFLLEDERDKESEKQESSYCGTEGPIEGLEDDGIPEKNDMDKHDLSSIELRPRFSSSLSFTTAATSEDDSSSIGAMSSGFSTGSFDKSPTHNSILNLMIPIMNNKVQPSRSRSGSPNNAG